MGLLSDPCSNPNCGNPKVPKAARFCRKCGFRAPGGWVKSSTSGKWLHNDAIFDPHTGAELHTDDHETVNLNGWCRTDDMVAQMVDWNIVRQDLPNGLLVKKGTVAAMMEHGHMSRLLEPGQHSIQGTIGKNRKDIRPCPVYFFNLAEAGFPLRFEGLATKDPISTDLVTKAVVSFSSDHLEQFVTQVMGDRRQFTEQNLLDFLAEELADKAQSVHVRSQARILLREYLLDDLQKKTAARAEFQERLGKELASHLQLFGLKLVRLASFEFEGQAREIEMEEQDTEQRRRKIIQERILLEELNKNEKIEIENVDDWKRVASAGRPITDPLTIGSKSPLPVEIQPPTPDLGEHRPVQIFYIAGGHFKCGQLNGLNFKIHHLADCSDFKINTQAKAAPWVNNTEWLPDQTGTGPARDHDAIINFQTPLNSASPGFGATLNLEFQRGGELQYYTGIFELKVKDSANEESERRLEVKADRGAVVHVSAQTREDNFKWKEIQLRKLPPPPPPPADAQNWFDCRGALVTFSQPSAQHPEQYLHLLTKPRLRFGRKREPINDLLVILPDADEETNLNVSREHFTLECEARGVFIRDGYERKASGNGTWVNGNPIPKKRDAANSTHGSYQLQPGKSVELSLRDNKLKEDIITWKVQFWDAGHLPGEWPKSIPALGQLDPQEPVAVFGRRDGRLPEHFLVIWQPFNLRWTGLTMTDCWLFPHLPQKTLPSSLRPLRASTNLDGWHVLSTSDLTFRLPGSI